MPMNIIWLNQQELFQAPFATPNQMSGRTTITSSSSKSIFSLSPNVSKENNETVEHNITTVNQGSTDNSESHDVNGQLGEQNDLKKGTKNTSMLFSPKKFVPSEKCPDLNLTSTIKSEELAESEKIKPKWSPNPSSNEQEPRYKKIQPIFQKPKSPHKIT